MRTLRMHKTPAWPGGDEPDRITDMKPGTGFADGVGALHFLPPGMTAAFKRDGRWMWAESDPAARPDETRTIATGQDGFR